MQGKSPKLVSKGSDAASVKEHLKKKTPQELAQMAIINRAFSNESSDDPPPLAHQKAEPTFAPLNKQLKSLPMVKAFNSAENQLDGTK